MEKTSADRYSVGDRIERNDATSRARFRIGDKVRIVGEPTTHRNYKDCTAEVVERPSDYPTLSHLYFWLRVTNAKGQTVGNFHTWEGYSFEVLELGRAVVGDRFSLMTTARPAFLHDGDVLRVVSTDGGYSTAKVGEEVRVVSGTGVPTGSLWLTGPTWGPLWGYSGFTFEVVSLNESAVGAKVPDTDYCVGDYVVPADDIDAGLVNPAFEHFTRGKRYRVNSYDPMGGWVRLPRDNGAEGGYSRQHFKLANAATADEAQLAKGVHVLCTSSGGDPENGNGVEEGVFYVVRSYTPNADPRLSGLVTLRGVDGTYSTQRFRMATPQERELLVEAARNTQHLILGLDTSRIQEFLRSYSFGPIVNINLADIEARTLFQPSDAVPPLFGTVTGRMSAEGPNPNEGLRFNDGKRRYDLMPPDALADLADVYTRGAEKYAERNWEKGMAWSKCLASLERHTAAWKAGEDRDPESGQRHMTHVAWNALALVAYDMRGVGTDDRYRVEMPAQLVAAKQAEVEAAKARVFEKSALAADHLAVELKEVDEYEVIEDEVIGVGDLVRFTGLFHGVPTEYHGWRVGEVNEVRDIASGILYFDVAGHRCDNGLVDRFERVRRKEQADKLVRYLIDGEGRSWYLTGENGDGLGTTDPAKAGRYTATRAAENAGRYKHLTTTILAEADLPVVIRWDTDLGETRYIAANKRTGLPCGWMVAPLERAAAWRGSRRDAEAFVSTFGVNNGKATIEIA